MNVRKRARVFLGRAPLAFLFAVALVGHLPAQVRHEPASTAALLEGSEISVTESGGFAGRIHSARLIAARGRVDVEYHAREAPASSPAFSGTLEPDRYVALWRELESASVWDVQSPKPSAGADQIQVELRVRLGDSGRVVRWDELSGQTTQMRRLTETANRVLEAGRQSAYLR